MSLAAAAASVARRLAPRVGGTGSARTVALGGAAALSALSLVPTASAKESVPPFTLDAPRYDQSTYIGRLNTIFEKIEPTSLFVSEAEVKRCQALLEKFAAGGAKAAGADDEELWKARATVDTCIHPVSKEMMFALGRMSAFVPMNVPICFLMLNAQSTGMVLFSHWVNQSYNVMNNYVNRSSLEVDWNGLLQPYGIAVSVSCGIALGMKKAMEVVPGLARLGLFVPYLAVISAGSCNVAFTRMDEWRGRGVCIFGPDGQELGMSLAAGKQAVFSTIATRSVCLPIPVLIVPPLVMKALPLTGAAATVTELLVIIGCISVALPAVLAILPQEMTVPVDGLEPQFQGLKDKAGKPITTAVVNKGL